MANESKPKAPATVRVYNRSERTFIHDSYRLAARSFADLPADVADLWTSDYPNDVVEAGVAQRELNGPALENAELKARVAELEAKLAATVKKGSDAL